MATAREAAVVNQYAIHRTISANTTNATSVTSAPATVHGWYLSNVNAAPRYLKLYDTASAPTVGTTTPVMTILIPGNTAGAAANVEIRTGLRFSSGIGIGLTTGVADNDTNAVAANEIIVHLFYSLKPFGA